MVIECIVGNTNPYPRADIITGLHESMTQVLAQALMEVLGRGAVGVWGRSPRQLINGLVTEAMVHQPRAFVVNAAHFMCLRWEICLEQTWCFDQNTSVSVLFYACFFTSFEISYIMCCKYMLCIRCVQSNISVYHMRILQWTLWRKQSKKHILEKTLSQQKHV